LKNVNQTLSKGFYKKNTITFSIYLNLCNNLNTNNGGLISEN